MLLYVLDGSVSASNGGRDPAADLVCLQRELELYDPTLRSKPALVLVNKSDIKGGKAALRRVEAEARRGGMAVLVGSAKEGAGMGPLAAELRTLLEARPATAAQ